MLSSPSFHDLFPDMRTGAQPDRYAPVVAQSLRTQMSKSGVRQKSPGIIVTREDVTLTPEILTQPFGPRTTSPGLTVQALTSISRVLVISVDLDFQFRSDSHFLGAPLTDWDRAEYGVIGRLSRRIDTESEPLADDRHFRFLSASRQDSDRYPNDRDASHYAENNCHVDTHSARPFAHGPISHDQNQARTRVC